MSLRRVLAATTATILVVHLFITTAHANTEKTIFLAPSPVNISPSFFDLNLILILPSIAPAAPTLRTSLPVAFPTDGQPHGVDSWYLLRHLPHRQRHEVRVCWPATQPTDFRLDTFDIPQLLENPHLLPALPRDHLRQQLSSKSTDHPTQESVLFLRVQAAADFFTTNHSRMRAPPPVDVDIILDPYLANIFPKSLLPTAIYITLLAILSYFISGFIWSNLSPPTKPHVE